VHPAIALRTRGDLEVHDLAADAGALLGGDAEGVDRTADLAAGVLDRLADLRAQGEA
jgi:hypothetical protein